MNVLDFKKDMGLWHGVLTVSLCGLMHMEVPEKLFILTLPAIQ